MPHPCPNLPKKMHPKPSKGSPRTTHKSLNTHHKKPLALKWILGKPRRPFFEEKKTTKKPSTSECVSLAAIWKPTKNYLLKKRKQRRFAYGFQPRNPQDPVFGGHFLGSPGRYDHYATGLADSFDWKRFGASRTRWSRHIGFYIGFWGVKA